MEHAGCLRPLGQKRVGVGSFPYGANLHRKTISRTELNARWRAWIANRKTPRDISRRSLSDRNDDCITEQRLRPATEGDSDLQLYCLFLEHVPTQALCRREKIDPGKYTGCLKGIAKKSDIFYFSDARNESIGNFRVPTIDRLPILKIIEM